jgi:hypothetical protein
VDVLTGKHLDSHKNLCHPACPGVPWNRLCPSTSTPAKVKRHPPFVIPTGAEGPAVRLSPEQIKIKSRFSTAIPLFNSNPPFQQPRPLQSAN